MRSALFLLAWLGATPPEPQVVVVTERETLAQIAQRTLGDANGASELKALNKLTTDAVPAGTRLKLPPEADRARALSALKAARNAVEQADRHASKREEASAKLREAETHFQSANYLAAAQAADNAWSLLSPNQGQPPSSFLVKVDETGATTVSVQTGPPVRVEAEKVTRPVHAGETVRVEKGQPPPPRVPPLAAPLLQAPKAGTRITLVPEKGRLGPVMLKWAAVAEAKEYEVEVVGPDGATLREKVSALQWKLPPQPAGTYRWTVRALSESQKSDAAGERIFELAEDKVKLQVGNPNWNQ